MAELMVLQRLGTWGPNPNKRNGLLLRVENALASFHSPTRTIASVKDPGSRRNRLADVEHDGGLLLSRASGQLAA
jgi:hypothetical protein